MYTSSSATRSSDDTPSPRDDTNSSAAATSKNAPRYSRMSACRDAAHSRAPSPNGRAGGAGGRSAPSARGGRRVVTSVEVPAAAALGAADLAVEVTAAGVAPAGASTAGASTAGVSVAGASAAGISAAGISTAEVSAGSSTARPPQATPGVPSAATSSSVTAGDCATLGVMIVVPTRRRVPQVSQKLAPSRLRRPHSGQRNGSALASCRPHASQNSAWSSDSAPQAVQKIKVTFRSGRSRTGSEPTAVWPESPSFVLGRMHQSVPDVSTAV